MEDEEIIALYWARDEQAIRETEIKYGIVLQRISQNIVRQKEDAEECVNDTYQKTWESIPPVTHMKRRHYLGRKAMLHW